MNASINKTQFAFSLGNFTYIDSTYEEAPDAVAEAPRSKIGRFLARCVSRLADWQRRREVIAEMVMMSDRELADIGLSRNDIARVFDPSFAADHTRGRDYIAY